MTFNISNHRSIVVKIRQFIGPSRKEAISLPPRECERRSGISAGRRLEIIRGEDGETNNNKKENNGRVDKRQIEKDSGGGVTAEFARKEKRGKSSKFS